MKYLFLLPLLFALKLSAQYTPANKSTGGTWTATEHNLMKSVLNGKLDTAGFKEKVQAAADSTVFDSTRFKKNGIIVTTINLADSAGTKTALAGKQAIDADLTTIAGLTATTDNTIMSVGGAWASRTPAQVKTVLGISDSATLIRVLSADPASGNMYINSTDSTVRYKFGSTWLKIPKGTVASAYGSELITNTSFAADASWIKDNGTTITGGEAVFNTATNFSILLYQDLAVVNTHHYKVEFDVTNWSSGSFQMGFGDLSGNGAYSGTISANGHQNFELFLNDADAPLVILFYSMGSGTVMHIDNLSVREIL